MGRNQQEAQQDVVLEAADDHLTDATGAIMALDRISLRHHAIFLIKARTTTQIATRSLFHHWKPAISASFRLEELKKLAAI